MLFNTINTYIWSTIEHFYRQECAGQKTSAVAYLVPFHLLVLHCKDQQEPTPPCTPWSTLGQQVFGELTQRPYQPLMSSALGLGFFGLFSGTSSVLLTKRQIAPASYTCFVLETLLEWKGRENTQSDHMSYTRERSRGVKRPAQGPPGQSLPRSYIGTLDLDRSSSTNVGRTMLPRVSAPAP